ncbi:MAG: rplD [Gammaproteobacteria bacterium]|jgi:large subunit ribosomal protein L4|nr:rplD [Gammaproteobacteria bacterium]
MELQITGAMNKTIEIADSVFARAFNEPLIHQVVTAYLSAGRAGTKAQKNRAAVRGGGIKPWRQKGTGRARAGTIRSPLWRKGGVTFAAQPRSYEQKVNKKMYRGALRSIVSELIRAERLLVVESFIVDTPKTKDFINKLNTLQLNARVLIITDTVEENLYLAARNLSTVEVRDVAAIDPVSLVGSEKVLMTIAALKQLEELLK